MSKPRAALAPALLAALAAFSIAACASAPPPSSPSSSEPGAPGPPEPAGQVTPASPGNSPAPGPPPSPGASAAPASASAVLTPAPAGAGPSCSRAVGECGYARCDEKAARCLFPCGSDADCVEGASCRPSPGNARIATCQMPIPFGNGAP